MLLKRRVNLPLVVPLAPFERGALGKRQSTGIMRFLNARLRQERLNDTVLDLRGTESSALAFGDMIAATQDHSQHRAKTRQRPQAMTGRATDSMDSPNGSRVSDQSLRRSVPAAQLAPDFLRLRRPCTGFSNQWNEAIAIGTVRPTVAANIKSL